MPSFPSLDAPLTDGTVRLRLSEEQDIPEILIAYQDDPVLHVGLREPRPPSGAALGRRAELALQERLAGRSVVLTILGQEADVCLGEVRIGDVEWSAGRAQLLLWVAPARRGRGVAGRAERLARGWLAQCGLEAVCPKAR